MARKRKPAIVSDDKHDEMTDVPIPLKSRRRLRFARVVQFLLVFLLLYFVSGIAIDRLYTGPDSMEEVAQVMPGVPVFPFSVLPDARGNPARGMAIPLTLLRWQGAKRAEAVTFTAPAQANFIRDWYLQTAPGQRWQLRARTDTLRIFRLIFSRGSEVLQVIVAPSRDLTTSYQMVYLDGMSQEQIAGLAAREGTPVVATTPQPVKPKTTATKPTPPPSATIAQPVVVKKPTVEAKPTPPRRVAQTPRRKPRNTETAQSRRETPARPRESSTRPQPRPERPQPAKPTYTKPAVVTPKAPPKGGNEAPPRLVPQPDPEPPGGDTPPPVDGTE